MNSNQLPVSGGVAIFFAIIIGYFVINPSALDGFRPGGQSSQIEQVHGIEDVQARLWQDPFAAAAAHQLAKHHTDKGVLFSGKVIIPPHSQEKRTPLEVTLQAAPAPSLRSPQRRHSLHALLNQIKTQSKESKQNVDILAVMVSAGPYPEERETRLRRRYAVIAGLAASGYQPQEPTHIGYIDNLADSACRQGHVGEGKMPKIIPFEWFKNDHDKYSLLLWLDESAFSYSPLCKLDFLIEKLSPGFDQQPKAPRSRISIIGPGESGTLQAMLNELDGKETNPDGTIPFLQLRRVLFFSATATAEARQLLKQDITESKKTPWKDPVALKFLSRHIIFFRTIAHDRKLTDELVLEIRNRLFDWSPLRANVKEHNFRIALVSEWDTLYGRSLPKAFTRSAYQSFHTTPPTQKGATAAWAQQHIYQFSYLRGIDGKVSSLQQANTPENTPSKADTTKDIHMERPEGNSQKDYLRRLASDMARTHQMLKNEGTKGIRAIGVLGSDVYDKLLILRALRKQFPKAIFFTTDLDAALLHPDQFQWTRNMLVSSSYGLKIASHHEILQISKGTGNQTKHFPILLNATKRTIPKNRDAYQTSVFLSSVWAASPTPSQNIHKRVESTIKKREAPTEAQISNAIEHAKQTIDSDTSPTLDLFFKQLLTQYSINIEEAIPYAIQKEFYRSFSQYIKPRVYEVGRYGAIDLAAIDNIKSITEWSPFYPLPVSSISSRAMIMITSSAVMLGLLSFLFWRRWIAVSGINIDKAFRIKMKFEDKKAIAAAVIALLVLFLCYLFDSSEDTLLAWILIDYLLIAGTFVYLIRRIIHEKEQHLRTHPCQNLLKCRQALIAMKQKKPLKQRIRIKHKHQNIHCDGDKHE